MHCIDELLPGMQAKPRCGVGAGASGGGLALLQALESVEVDWLPWVGDLFTEGNDFESTG